ncbi:MAG: hypothetical protein QM628_17890 [Propionicimonas sp.]
MGILRRRSIDPAPPPTPPPFVAEVLSRIGEEYGGFDTTAPLTSGGGGAGIEVVMHIVGAALPSREPFLRGTGIVRTARVFADRTEVYDGDRLIARFDDLTTTDVFGARG